MPVRNCGSYIEEAVDCILRQTFADFEFLIVDDASTDDTWERLRKYTDPRIRLYDVCYKAGYLSPSYFSKLFKKHTGVAPSEYRELLLPIAQKEDAP